MNKNMIEKYVPEPTRVKHDTYIACHYYPGWEVGGDIPHGGMLDLVNYPERTPIQGYYDGKDPEVLDWEIKWACEHGIDCFIFCWYRYKENMGHPVTVDSIRLGDTIHKGFFRAKYQHYMDFAIMWECDVNWGSAEDKVDLCENLLPFWVKHYFSKPNYMKIDGKPVVYVYAGKYLIQKLGSAELCREALNACKKEIKKYGFEDIIFAVEHGIPDMELLNNKMEGGFDYTFQYGQAPLTFTVEEGVVNKYRRAMELDSDFVIDYQLKCINNLMKNWPKKAMYTVSCFRDSSEEWEFRMGRTRLSDCVLMWKLTPVEFKKLLRLVKHQIEELDMQDIGRRILVIDNWNEWGEGHYIAPCAEHGFQYLQAIREVFTECDNLPDYRLPETVGLGPYDNLYKDVTGEYLKIQLGKTIFAEE